MSRRRDEWECKGMKVCDGCGRGGIGEGRETLGERGVEAIREGRQGEGEG